ncbi:alpha-ketoglutarate decarboxylase [uncultured Maribacter sp.]|uniref:alpha-ketoglutarate decarboxylase n=1 Tax=uncultured Maribacter sp. TaxID=431308 RepID=UPI00262BC497|nr:alpha-ketoglutarate decarboxylase [uncultured Maribacter sp.]
MTKTDKTLLKSFFCLIFFALSINLCNSQNLTSQNSFWKNVQFGGGIGLGFSNGGFNGTLSPSALYNVNRYISTGISLNINYAKYDFNKLFAYGGSILTLYNPTSFLQLSGELEQLRINETLDLVSGTIKNNYWSPALFLGAGYRSNNITFGIRYDVLHDKNKSIYADAWMPFVRVYF